MYDKRLRVLMAIVACVAAILFLIYNHYSSDKYLLYSSKFLSALTVLLAVVVLIRNKKNIKK
jgi:hypothetical protein